MRKLIAFIIGVFSIAVSYSQNGDKYSSTESDVSNAINLYDHFTANNAPIYNGKEYVYYTFRMKGDPFFISAKFSKGWVSYEGKKYESVDLLYDLSRSELIILNFNGKSAIVLHNEMVDSFFVSQNKFVNLEEDPKEHLVHAGYYNLLHEGKIQVLAKRSKDISNTIENDVLIRVFSSQTHYYIRKNNSYYPVSNSKDVFRVLSDKKHELKRLMRQNHVKFKRKAFESSLVKAAELYDQIN